VQVCKLVQSQQLLSNQLEELSLQIGQVHHAARQQQQQRGSGAAEAALQQRWERAAWALGGAALGALSAVLVLRGGRS